ncbi:MAG: hypothetical protein LBH40_05495 [Alphaproteobacteria bacterium]|jgi:predicted transcriptional regulator|nr:hypothetical protein [Alphaproteobacteria bacterium]
MKTISVRVPEDKLKLLDNISKAEQLDRSAIINNLINDKISLYQWQLEKIDRAIKQADNGEYSTNEELLKLLLD